ncbi:MAG TPA: hypothetical protein VJ697_13385 [Nitrososphaeraceae archaeon]|nr:hypothetical protein [Nitrososphaeraceae archaeon]
MNKKICKICNTPFTRKWNLARHLKDSHQIPTKEEIQNMNSEFDNNHISAERYNNRSHKLSHRYNCDGMNEINYSGTYNNYNEIPPNYSYPGYFNGQGYPWFNFNFQSEKEQKRWTYDDQIRIQSILKILQNYLEKIYHQFYVSRTIFRLKRKCNDEKSDELVKKFFIRKNIGYLWP